MQNRWKKIPPPKQAVQDAQPKSSQIERHPWYTFIWNSIKIQCNINDKKNSPPKQSVQDAQQPKLSQIVRYTTVLKGGACNLRPRQQPLKLCKHPLAWLEILSICKQKNSFMMQIILQKCTNELNLFERIDLLKMFASIKVKTCCCCIPQVWDNQLKTLWTTE